MLPPLSNCKAVSFRAGLVFSKMSWCLLVVCGTALAAQPDRIPGTISSDQTMVLHGNVHPKARPQYDQGRVEPSREIPNITLLTRPTPSQRAELKRFLAQQQDPSSVNYRRGLTPEQYADRFGLSPSDVNKMTNWLLSQGFTIAQVARGRDWIVVNGTAALVEKVFRTEIHSYLVDGEKHFANAIEPSIPRALEGILVGLHGLNDFRLKPAGLRNPGALFADILRPMYTSGFGNYLAPDDVATIYDIFPLYKAGINGAGAKLVIVGQTDIKIADIENFRAGFNLPKNDPVVKLFGSDPGISSVDLPEADLDLEWSGAVAREASIIYANSTNVLYSVFEAIDQALAPVISMSYALCESQTLGEIANVELALMKANAENITFLSSSGDAGAAGCDDFTEHVAVGGLAVDYPASSPEVTGVGGSEFSGDVNNASQYWGNSNNSNGESALSYIPEMTWNDTYPTGNGPILVPVLFASGGGASSCAISGSAGGCSGFPKPAWQAALTPKDAVRDVPDVSMSASPEHDGYIVCTNGSCPTGNAAGIASAVASGSTYGGTSVSSPVFAGIVTLLNQALGNTGSGAGLGNVNPILYSLAEQQFLHGGAAVFHDITTGSNIVPCSGGSHCPLTPPFQFGYEAGAGYDQVTGLGSVDAYQLISQLSGKIATTTALNATPAPPVVLGTSVALTATVKPLFNNHQALGGTVTFADATLGKLGTATVNSSGVATITDSTLAATSYSITAAYEGSPSFSGSASSAVPYSVQDFEIAPPNPSTVIVGAPGKSGTTTLTITPLNGFNRTLSYSCSGLPLDAVCTFTPVSSTKEALTIRTGAPAARFDKSVGRYGGRFLYALLAPGFLGLIVCLSGTRQSWRGIRWLGPTMLLTFVVVFTPACGGGGSGSTSSDPGTPIGSSSVTLTATTGSLSHSVQITLTVQ